MDLAKLKVVELRAHLAARGLDQKGVKAVLVSRLQAALEQESQPQNTNASIVLPEAAAGLWGFLLMSASHWKCEPNAMAKRNIFCIPFFLSCFFFLSCAFFRFNIILDIYDNRYHSVHAYVCGVRTQ